MKEVFTEVWARPVQVMNERITDIVEAPGNMVQTMIVPISNTRHEIWSKLFRSKFQELDKFT